MQRVPKLFRESSLWHRIREPIYARGVIRKETLLLLLLRITRWGYLRRQRGGTANHRAHGELACARVGGAGFEGGVINWVRRGVFDLPIVSGAARVFRGVRFWVAGWNRESFRELNFKVIFASMLSYWTRFTRYCVNALLHPRFTCRKMSY